MASSYAKSTTAYGKEFLAFSDGQFGLGDPAQWNGIFYDRVSQCGPGAGPAGIADLSFVLTAISRTAGLITGTISVPLATCGMTVGGLINIAGVNADPTLNGKFPIVSLAGAGTTTFTAWGNPGIWPVNSMVRAAGVVTAVLQQTPSFIVGNTIIIGGALDPTYDGSFTVASINGNIVTWNQVAPNSSTLTAILYTAPASSAQPLVLVGTNPTLTFLVQFVPTANVSSFVVGATITIQGNSTAAYNTQVVITSGPTVLFNGNIQFQTTAPAAGTGTGTGGSAFVSQPNSAPAVTGVAGPAGNIPLGVHKVAVFFETRSLYYTKPSPWVTWNAAGGFKATVTGIPTGPANVLQRILIFTETDGSVFYFTTNASNELASGNMVINDNVTTTLIVDFSDTILAAGSNAQYLYGLLELEESAGVVSYATRLFWWGCRNRVPNFLNMPFDGGWGIGLGTGGGDVPLGWTSDLNNGAGGSRFVNSPVFGDAYAITGDGAAAIRGMITQPAALDFQGDVIILPNTAYSFRVKTFGPVAHASTPYHITVELFSPTAGSLGSGTISPAAVGTGPLEFIAPLMAAQAVIPSDLLLRVYASGTLGNLIVVAIDDVEVFPTNRPYLNTTVRASYAGQPESYDELTGVLQPFFQDGGTIRNAFVLREKLYICKDNKWYVTEDDGANEPSAWKITVVSLAVGACGINASDLGEDWGIIANRAGPYIFWGGEPVKIGQEIESDSSLSGKPTWSSINWAFGYTIWVLLDRVNKRALIGAPINGATSPNVIFYFDFVAMDEAKEVADHWSVKYSAYTGKILAIGNAPKWAPWNISSNSAALIERSDGTAHTFIGNGAAAPLVAGLPSSTGKIYDLSDANKNDDGAGIPWSYSTYFTPSHMEEQALQIKSHRKLYAYLSGFVRGAGAMAISLQPMGNITPTPYQPLQLVDPTVSNAITSISRVNGVTTVTCAGGHGLTNGIDLQAVIQNAADTSFNGTVPIQQILNATQFTFAQFLLPDLILGAGGTLTRLSREFEYTTNVLGERVSYTFSNSGNAPGSWCQMEKIIFSIVPDPWSPVRGSVY